MIETMIASSSFDLSLLPYQRIEGMKEEDLASYLMDEDKKLILLALDKKVIAFVALSVGVIFHSHLSVGFLQFVVGGVFAHAKHFVIVSLFIHIKKILEMRN